MILAELREVDDSRVLANSPLMGEQPCVCEASDERRNGRGEVEHRAACVNVGENHSVLDAQLDRTIDKNDFTCVHTRPSAQLSRQGRTDAHQNALIHRLTKDRFAGVDLFPAKSGCRLAPNFGTRSNWWGF